MNSSQDIPYSVPNGYEYNDEDWDDEEEEDTEDDEGDYSDS